MAGALGQTGWWERLRFKEEAERLQAIDNNKL
jgi:hypothetical protein